MDEGNGSARVALLLVLLVPVAFVFWVYDNRFGHCFRLENGANLGYAALFDLSRPLFKPIAVPKLENGAPIVRDELWLIKVTDTTIYGLTMGVKDGDYVFAWRQDTGIVLRYENPTLYTNLVIDAGHANWDIDVGSIGTRALLDRMLEKPGFEAERCQTFLITW